MKSNQLLKVLRAAEFDQTTYTDILYQKGSRMAVSYEAAKARLANTREAIDALEKAIAALDARAAQ